MDLLQVNVVQVSQPTMDTKIFKLERPGGGSLPPASAGAHIDVHLASGLIRQYSLCGDPADCSAYLIGVKREAESRGGSVQMHDCIDVGMPLRISEPRNNFPLSEDARRHILLAGGIGITPLLSMAHRLAAQSAEFQLHYFVRSRAHAGFAASMDKKVFADRTLIHDDLSPQQVQQRLEALLDLPAAGDHLYLCGPRAFMELALMIAADWPSDHVHTEFFAAASVDNHSTREPESFTVRLARSGGEYLVGKDQTIVSVLAEHEIYIDTSCEEGLCGTCIVDVLEGIPLHRDEVLTQEERHACNKIVTCVSRAKSKVIVLDI